MIQKSGSVINEVWSAGSVYRVTGSVTVPYGSTLTIEAGAIIKSSVDGGSNGTIEVAYGGTLNVEGTAVNPVIFTSYKDDSWGGDSNGDGYSIPSNGDYGIAVKAQSYTTATINVQHAIFQYGTTALWCYAGTVDLAVTDNTFKNGVNLMYCGNPEFKRNTFDVTEGYMTSQASVTVTGFSFALLTKSIGVAGTIMTMADAYDNCAP